MGGGEQKGGVREGLGVEKRVNCGLDVKQKGGGSFETGGCGRMGN